MKLLVATSKTQKQRANDFNFVPDGEIVMFGSECSSPHGRAVDGACGCRRSLSGVLSLKGTTTFEVMETAYKPEDARTLIEDYLKRTGFVTDNGSQGESIMVEEGILDLLSIVRFCEPLEVGTVVERRGDNLRVRA